MFRKNKDKPDKAKLEHKLYLARETPEPIFDLSDCNIREIPAGIYSLCRVFIKEVLNLESNRLMSLDGGGNLVDLRFLKVLNLSSNCFRQLPKEINTLVNLQELYISNNELKSIPESFCDLRKLKILDLSHNRLKCLPHNLGFLKNLHVLRACGNPLQNLPKSAHCLKTLVTLELDYDKIVYPPSEVVEKGAKETIQYICNDLGVPYECIEGDEDEVDKGTLSKNDRRDSDNDSLQAKIWELDAIKKQKAQEFLEIERFNETLQKFEAEAAFTSKVQREKLLADLTKQQYQLDTELNKIQRQRDMERFRLIEQLQEVENSADMAVKHLLEINKEPQLQLLEQEEEEKHRLLETAMSNRQDEYLRRDDILRAMRDILEQETVKLMEFHQNREENTQSLLEREIEADSMLSLILISRDKSKRNLIEKLKVNDDYQKAAVGALLEKSDARSWGLLQQIKIVESQLIALTDIELDKKRLKLDEHMNDLCEKRVNLSILLLELLEKQKERHEQLVATLQEIEKKNDCGVEDFWLRQYQRLLEKLPEGLSRAQNDIDPGLAKALLMNGVVHCLPFLARISLSNKDEVNETDLINAGMANGEDRTRVLAVFKQCEKDEITPSAPPAETEPSAPLSDNIRAISTSECVVCMDLECEIIFVPCGHFCCCKSCASSLKECPMCRGNVEKKITLV